jgi:galactokinase
MAVYLEEAGHFRLDPVEIALIGPRAENRFVGVNCGILDQSSSAMGRAGSALLPACRSLTSRVAAIAPGIRVVICDTSWITQTHPSCGRIRGRSATAIHEAAVGLTSPSAISRKGGHGKKSARYPHQLPFPHHSHKRRENP